MDWVGWHHGYDIWPPLQARLRAVREHISNALIRCSIGPIGVVSLCAGDGRDLIGLLSEHSRRDDVSALLVEANGDLVSRGEAAITQFDLGTHVRIVRGDATQSSAYLEVVPADVVVAAGVFGNLRDSEVRRLIFSLRCLCKWGRSSSGPALIELEGERAAALIRDIFREAQFEQIASTRTSPGAFAVATHAFRGTRDPPVPGITLFEFAGFDQIGATQSKERT
jgi:hypothetical protein